MAEPPFLSIPAGGIAKYESANWNCAFGRYRQLHQAQRGFGLGIRLFDRRSSLEIWLLVVAKSPFAGRPPEPRLGDAPVASRIDRKLLHCHRQRLSV